MRSPIHPSVIKTCEYCGKTFTIKFSRAEKTRFCSLVCKLAGYKLPVAFCINCGKEFGAVASQGKDNRQKFCCRECRWAYFRSIRVPIVLVCERCDKEFEVYPSRFKFGNPRFCSGSCANNIRRSENERYRRLKTPAWAEIRNRILIRDSYRCIVCKSKKSLVIHHLSPWVKSRNDSDVNLVTVCRTCHQKVEWGLLACPVPLF